jgi:hypothetical protein
VRSNTPLQSLTLANDECLHRDCAGTGGALGRDLPGGFASQAR